MTCNSNCYLPLPPRAWSRVQNNCSLFEQFQDDPGSSATARMPYSGKIVPASTLYLEYAMLNKGNVLQYKKNSSSLTKQQRYAQIAKGCWTNRNTTWATQSTRGYTNPNNQSLQRVNSINITLAGVPTLSPVTCPKPVVPVNDTLPPASSGGSENPETLPPPPPPPTTNLGTVLPATVPDPPIEPVVIQDLGNLVCGTQENVCTGELIRQPSDIICHPTTDSDVPGQITELCWNDGTPTWYPRQRYVMSNSGNKWPVNATLLSAIKPLPPIITSVTNIGNEVTLTWTQDEICLEVTNFTIYEDGIPVKIVSGNMFKTSIIVNNCTTYTFYIVGSNENVISDSSNSVTIDIFVPLAPFNLSYILLSSTSIRLYWEIDTVNDCSPATNYIIYYNSSSITISASNITYDISGLISDTIYNIHITSINAIDISLPSSTLTVTTNSVPFTITGGGTSSYIGGYYYVPFISIGTITFINNLQNIYVAIVGGGGGGGWSNTSPYSCGGGGGGQSLIPYSTVLTNNIFNISSIGAYGIYGSPQGTSGSYGTSTIFSDYMSTYTVTGGKGGSYSSSSNTPSGTYSGPSISPTNNNILSGTGGYGGHGQSGSSANNAAHGENSYFSTTNPANINIIYSLGGGGGGCGNSGGEGGSRIGPGLGGPYSNSSNLNTQEAGGYGAGGGSYYNISGNPKHPGSGTAGICIVFFQF